MPKLTTIPKEDRDEIDKISPLVPKVYDEEWRLEILYKFQHETPHNIELCAQKLNDATKWREENNMVDILGDEDKKRIYDEVKQHFYFDLHKHDNDGRPVVYFALGKANIKLLFETIDHEKVKICLYYFIHLSIEEARKKCKELGVQFLDATLVIDMDGMTLLSHAYTPALPLFKQISADITNNFPGNFNMIYIINASWTFRTLYKLITPFMSQTVKDELLVFGGYDELPAYIPIANIPLVYGGTCHCSNLCLPNCEVKIPNDVETTIESRSTLEYHLYGKSNDTIYYSLLNKKDDDLEVTIIHIPEGESRKTKKFNKVYYNKNVATGPTPITGTASNQTNGTYVITIYNSAIFSSVKFKLEFRLQN